MAHKSKADSRPVCWPARERERARHTVSASEGEGECWWRRTLNVAYFWGPCASNVSVHSTFALRTVPLPPSPFFRLLLAIWICLCAASLATLLPPPSSVSQLCKFLKANKLCWSLMSCRLAFHIVLRTKAARNLLESLLKISFQLSFYQFWIVSFCMRSYWRVKKNRIYAINRSETRLLLEN